MNLFTIIVYLNEVKFTLYDDLLLNNIIKYLFHMNLFLLSQTKQWIYITDLCYDCRDD